MSKMLSLPIHAWTLARQAIRDGRSADALRWLARVTMAENLPANEVAEAHREAARLHTKFGRYARARRELRAASRLEPHHAETWFHLGMAYEHDPYGSDLRAASAYRRATQLCPTHALSWAYLARAAVRTHRDALARHAIRRAIQFAPTQADVLMIVAEALREAGRLKTAERIVNQARFLAPTDAGVRGVWNRLQFEMLRDQQQTNRRRRVSTSPHVLPFVRLVDADGHTHIIRRDHPPHRSEPHVMRIYRD